MTDMTVAKTILEQLGGNRFIAMTGAKNFSGTENSLLFRVPSRKANWVKITLDASDTYTMEFSLVRGANIKSVKQVSMVYFDMLQDIFEEVTGFYTHF